MEDMGYIFVDIEWNQRVGTTTLPYREPVQIAIIETTEDLKFRKRFSQHIALENINTLTETTVNLAHINKAALLKAKSAREVFNYIESNFKNYNKIVVWTVDTYELLCMQCKKHDVKLPKHDVVVLQDILSYIADDKDKKIRFEKALDKMNIKYEEKNLHYSFHDTSYLYELFKRTYSKYVFMTKEEYGIVNRNSKVIHAPGCRHTRMHTLECGSNVKQLIFKGYRPCKHCMTSEMWERLDWKGESRKVLKHNQEKKLREMPLTDEVIGQICQHFELKYNIISDLVFVETPTGYWRVKLKGDKVDKVYHGNYRVPFEKKKRAERMADKFHRQYVKEDNFYDVIRYIYYHDKNIYKSVKKTRMEQLFEKIECENRMKKLKYGY